jgi:non-ribosomal peptide synthetase component F
MAIQDSSRPQSGIANGRSTPRATDIVEAFKRQAARVPGKRAVEFAGAGLTYRELDLATNRLARLFMASGVGDSSRVAVAMPRGLGEFCSFLAVLKAGGAFVPIDSSHPADRVRQVLEDAEPQIVIAPSSSPLRGSFPEGVPLVSLDDPLDIGSAYSDAPLDCRCDPERLDGTPQGSGYSQGWHQQLH